MSNGADRSPVQIGKDLYWVGHYLEDDRFQCHAYLLVHGDNSVLFDPGSVLTFPHTLRKIEQIIAFTKIRYFVCQHQDPDITGSMPLIDQMNAREDACLVTHWRAVVLLRHLGLKMPFWEVSEHDWMLDLGGRLLEFVFTPYLHFPGAITTFDRQTGTLFSSDLFGGFTKGNCLYAQDIGCFDGIRAFHEHYMPGREALLSGMLRLEKLPLELIAPQHGQIIRKPLIAPIIERLKSLECGLFLLSQRDTRVERLLQLSETLRAMLRTLNLERELRTIGVKLLELTQQVIPAESLDFLIREQTQFVLLGQANRYRGAPIEPSELLTRTFGLAQEATQELLGSAVHIENGVLVLPLFASTSGYVEGLALLKVPDGLTLDDELVRLLTQMAGPLAVALERDSLLRQMEQERDAIYAQAIRDPLTELYTRRHMNEVVARLVALHDRDERASFAVLVLDLDHFKSVNDSHGHQAGDAVLKGTAEIVRKTIRASDIAIRYGGEEIVVLADVPDQAQGIVLAERVRNAVELVQHQLPDGVLRVSVSVGVALRLRKEPFADCLRRADGALYEAKHQGRNRVNGAPLDC